MALDMHQLRYRFTAALLVSGLLFFFSAPSVFAANVQWNGGGDGSTWEQGSNWNTGSAPTDADHAIILTATTVNINAPTTVDRLTIGNGSNATVLNFNYDALTDGALVVDNLDFRINNNASVTHTAGDSGVNGSIYIDVQNGNAVLNGDIDIDGKGYTSENGTGAGSSILNAGGGGAGHGGLGGQGGTPLTGADGGTSYGSVSAPTTLGSGGGGSDVSTDGGSGGGAVRLDVSGTITVTGSITANGDDSGTADINDGAGGGAGGSIYLDVGTFDGDGTISANGGAGGVDNDNGGGAGGGRIAIYYTTEDASAPTVTAYGGAGQSDSGDGGAGTIYKKQGTSNPDLIVDNNDIAGFANTVIDGYTPLTSGTFGSITASNYGAIEVATGQTVTYSSLTWSNQGVLIDNGGTFSAFSGSTLSVPSSAILFANTTRSYSTGNISGTVATFDNETTDDSSAHKIDMTFTGNLTVGNSGSINVNGRGLQGGNGTGVGTSPVNSGASGGSYGGTGGVGDSNESGTGSSYGSTTAPTALGSGGGHSDDNDDGGDGGGAIRLTVNGTLDVKGSISADGADGDGDINDGAGGGSGGSIYITVGTLDGNGTISADGGDGGNKTDDGGGGGGGRIAIEYTTEDATAPTVTAYGGAEPNNEGNGGAGTIYKIQGGTTSELIIDNNSSVDFSSTDDYRQGITPLGAVHLTTLTIQNDGNAEVVGTTDITYSTLNWSTNGVITDNDSGTAATFAVLSGSTLTVPQGALLFANTARSYSVITINGELSHSNNYETATNRINLTSTGDITIAATATVDLTGRGFREHSGDGAGLDQGNWGAGGGHGGTGGATSDGGSSGGTSYGSSTAPTTLGSGGGNDGGFDGGHGGGAIQLTASGNLSLGVDITANGASASDTDAGGGAGGSIYLDIAGSISGDGHLYVLGGSGQESNAGAGAGGRIRIECAGRSWTGWYWTRGGATGVSADYGTYSDECHSSTGPTVTVEGSANTNTYLNPILTTSAFVDDGEHAHSDTDWKIVTSADCDAGTIAWSSIGDTSNLTSIEVNSSEGTFAGPLNGLTDLDANTTYYACARHLDAWSSAQSFTTTYECTASDQTYGFDTAGNYTVGSNVTITGSAARTTSAAWIEGEWPYRMPVTVNNSSGSSQTDFQVRIELDNSDSDFFTNLDSSNGDDIRITDTDGITEIDYWIESIDTGSQSAVIWAKIPSLSASSKTLYLYYGKSGASAASSMDDVFLVADDFSSGSLNSEWNEITQDGGIAGTFSDGKFTKSCNGDCNWWNNDDIASAAFVRDPGGSWEAVTLMDSMGTGVTNSQGGIMLWESDTDGYIWGYHRLNTRFEAQSTNATALCTISSTTLPAYLKVTKSTSNAEGSANTYSFARSADGASWTACGTYTTSDVMNNVGVMVKDWGTGTSSATFDHFHIQKYQSTTPSVAVGSQETGGATNSTVVTNSPVSISNLIGFTDSFNASGQARYQISPNGTNWYYHNGSAWVTASLDFAEADIASEVQAAIPDFIGEIGASEVYIRALVYSTDGGNGNLKDITISYDSIPCNPSVSSADNARLPSVSSASFVGADGHTSSDWKVLSSGDCSTGTAVWEATDDTSNKTSTTVNASNGSFANSLSGKTVLAPSTSYSACVRHTNSGGDSSWSAASSFTSSANQTPSTPTNSAPADAATGVSTTPTLTGSTFSDPDTDQHEQSDFVVYASADCSGDATYSATENGASPHQHTVAADSLSGNTTYSWRVRYTDDYSATTGYSTCTSFSTSNTVPTVSSIPTQTWNEDESTVLDLADYFSDPDGDSLSYSILGADTPESDITVTIDGSEVTFSSADDWNGSDTITFVATDTNAGSTNSNQVTLNVSSVNDVPDAPSSGFSPANNDITATQLPTIEWDAASDVDHDAEDIHYVVRIGTSVSPSTSYESEYTTEDGIAEVTVTDELNDVTNYYYAVKAVDAAGGESAWSTAQRFRVDIGAAPILSLTKIVGINVASANAGTSGFALLGAPAHAQGGLYASNSDQGIVVIQLIFILAVVMIGYVIYEVRDLRKLTSMLTPRSTSQSFARYADTNHDGTYQMSYAQYIAQTRRSQLLSYLSIGLLALALAGLTIVSRGLSFTNQDGVEVEPGDVLTYQIAYRNSGNGDATASALIDRIPEGSSLVSGSIVLNSVVQSDSVVADDVVTLDTGTIAAGTSGLAQFSVRISNPTDYTGDAITGGASRLESNELSDVFSESVSNPLVTSTISGVVRNANTEKGVSGAVVVLQEQGTPIDALVTPKSGAYSFDQIGSGSYRIAVTTVPKRFKKPDSKRVAVEKDAVSADNTIDLALKTTSSSGSARSNDSDNSDDSSANTNATDDSTDAPSADEESTTDDSTEDAAEEEVATATATTGQASLPTIFDEPNVLSDIVSGATDAEDMTEEEKAELKALLADSILVYEVEQIPESGVVEISGVSYADSTVEIAFCLDDDRCSEASIAQEGLWTVQVPSDLFQDDFSYAIFARASIDGVESELRQVALYSPQDVTFADRWGLPLLFAALAVVLGLLAFSIWNRHVHPFGKE